MTRKYECKNIIILTDNLLPLLAGRELAGLETIYLLNKVEGSSDKGRVFRNSNKNTLLLKTKLQDNFGDKESDDQFDKHKAKHKRTLTSHQNQTCV